MLNGENTIVNNMAPVSTNENTRELRLTGTHTTARTGKAGWGDYERSDGIHRPKGWTVTTPAPAVPQEPTPTQHQFRRFDRRITVPTPRASRQRGTVTLDGTPTYPHWDPEPGQEQWCPQSQDQQMEHQQVANQNCRTTMAHVSGTNSAPVIGSSPSPPEVTRTVSENSRPCNGLDEDVLKKSYTSKPDPLVQRVRASPPVGRSWRRPRNQCGIPSDSNVPPWALWTDLPHVKQASSQPASGAKTPLNTVALDGTPTGQDSEVVGGQSAVQQCPHGQQRDQGLAPHNQIYNMHAQYLPGYVQLGHGQANQCQAHSQHLLQGHAPQQQQQLLLLQQQRGQGQGNVQHTVGNVHPCQGHSQQTGVHTQYLHSHGQQEASSQQSMGDMHHCQGHTQQQQLLLNQQQGLGQGIVQHTMGNTHPCQGQSQQRGVYLQHLHNHGQEEASSQESMGGMNHCQGHIQQQLYQQQGQGQQQDTHAQQFQNNGMPHQLNAQRKVGKEMQQQLDQDLRQMHSDIQHTKALAQQQQDPHAQQFQNNGMPHQLNAQRKVGKEMQRQLDQDLRQMHSDIQHTQALAQQQQVNEENLELKQRLLGSYLGLPETQVGHMQPYQGCVHAQQHQGNLGQYHGQTGQMQQHYVGQSLGVPGQQVGHAQPCQYHAQQAQSNLDHKVQEPKLQQQELQGGLMQQQQDHVHQHETHAPQAQADLVQQQVQGAQMEQEEDNLHHRHGQHQHHSQCPNHYRHAQELNQNLPQRQDQVQQWQGQVLPHTGYTQPHHVQVQPYQSYPQQQQGHVQPWQGHTQQEQPPGQWQPCPHHNPWQYHNGSQQYGPNVQQTAMQPQSLADGSRVHHQQPLEPLIQAKLQDSQAQHTGQTKQHQAHAQKRYSSPHPHSSVAHQQVHRSPQVQYNRHQQEPALQHQLQAAAQLQQAALQQQQAVLRQQGSLQHQQPVVQKEPDQPHEFENVQQYLPHGGEGSHVGQPVGHKVHTPMNPTIGQHGAGESCPPSETW